eukprot:1141161-Pelagomonas_calceolata.AAC.1
MQLRLGGDIRHAAVALEVKPLRKVTQEGVHAELWVHRSHLCSNVGMLGRHEHDRAASQQVLAHRQLQVQQAPRARSAVLQHMCGDGDADLRTEKV